MLLTISLTDVQQFADIPTGIDFNKRILIHQQQAERVDLKAALGILFFSQVTKEYGDGNTDFVELVEGGTYTYDGIEIEYAGIKPIVINYMLSRFYKKAQVNVTRKSVVNKTNQYSKPVKDEKISELSIEARTTAKSFEDDMFLFLKENKEKFELFWKHKLKGTRKTSVNIMSSSKTRGTKDGFPNNYFVKGSKDYGCCDEY